MKILSQLITVIKLENVCLLKNYMVVTVIDDIDHYIYVPANVNLRTMAFQ